MAEFILRNSLNPSKAVQCAVTYRQVVPKGIEGEALWVVEVVTTEPDVSGNSIAPEYINLVDLTYLEDEIAEAVERISTQIDWSPLIEDTRAPYVESLSPSTYEVPLETSVEVVLKDLLPAAGIDVDSIIMTVNGEDVTNELEITGDPYEYNIKWSPFIRIMDEY